MSDDSLLPFDLPAVRRKKVCAAFDGGRVRSDGGVLLLTQAAKRPGIAGKLAAAIDDPRDPARLTHFLPDILLARILAISAGYEDADDLDHLRHDPAFKLSIGRLPEAAVGLCSQPTMSRWENAPKLREIVQLMGVMVDVYCASYASPPQAVTLDIDDTVDIVHGHQQLSLFNAHHDERCFLPIHIYDTATSRPVAVILRPGRTPSGREIAGHLRRLIRRLRRHWPTTAITIRGDSHYGRHEVMTFCEANDIRYVFGLAGNDVLTGLVDAAADRIRTERALEGEDKRRGYTGTRYAARSWLGPDRQSIERRVCARIEATRKGLDARFVVTNLTTGSAETIYAVLYCARGQAGNLIKLHKTRLASDRTSCRSPLANQMRLILHTAACWLMLTLREGHPDHEPARQGRIRNHPNPTRQTRRPHPGNRIPHQDRLRRRLPASQPLAISRQRAHAGRTLKNGPKSAQNEPRSPTSNTHRRPNQTDDNRRANARA